MKRAKWFLHNKVWKEIFLHVVSSHFQEEYVLYSDTWGVKKIGRNVLTLVTFCFILSRILPFNILSKKNCLHLTNQPKIAFIPESSLFEIKIMSISFNVTNNSGCFMT